MFRKTVPALLAATLLVSMTAGTALAARPIVVLSTLMTGAAERPGPGDADALGVAVVLIVPRTDTICWVVTWNRVDGTVVAAHIHGPVGTDEPGPVVVPMFANESFAGRGIHHDCVRSPDWADAIAENPEQFYVNVHSAPDFGSGAIRGQLD